MSDFIIAYDLPGASTKQREELKKTVCKSVLVAERRLRTTWWAISTLDTPQKLKAKILRRVRNNGELGQEFATNNLKLVVAMADNNTDKPITTHRAPVLERC